MTPNHPEALPGMELGGVPDDKTGPVEVGVDKALATLRAGGWLTDVHAHIEALAKSTAHHYDRLSPFEKAYGRAQVTQALAKVFELLPQPDAAADAKWQEFMQALENAE